MNKKGQEEMVGFAVISIIIGVIILVVIGFMVNKKDTNLTADYEIESFIQSSLQYTSECQDSLGFVSLQELIISCRREETCLDGKSSCDALNSTLKGLVENAWTVGDQSSIKGYEFDIKTGEQSTLNFKKGNQTANYISGFQSFARNGQDYTLSLNLYS